jgi:type II secretory pathway component PulC
MLNGAKFQQLFTGDTENKAALGVVVFLVLLLSLTVIWQIVDLWEFAVQLKGQSQQLANRHMTINVATHTEEALLLFGQSKDHPKERVNTQYTLLGIMMSTDPKRSKAIIQLPGEQPKIYTVGEQVNGLKIKGVHADRVILSGYDREESLYISWNKSGQNNTNTYSETGDNPSEDSPVADNAPAYSAPQIDVESVNNQAEQMIEKTVQNISNSGAPQMDQEQLAKIRERLQQFREKGGIKGFGGRFGGGI